VRRDAEWEIRDARLVYYRPWCLHRARPHRADPSQPDRQSGTGLSSVRRPDERCPFGRSSERDWVLQSNLLGGSSFLSGRGGIRLRNGLVMYKADWWGEASLESSGGTDDARVGLGPAEKRCGMWGMEGERTRGGWRE
jgi:hypothetical protein